MSGCETPKLTLPRSLQVQEVNRPLVSREILHVCVCCKGRINPAVVRVFNVSTDNPHVGPSNKILMKLRGIVRMSLNWEFTFTARLVVNIFKNVDSDQPCCREIQICFIVAWKSHVFLLDAFCMSWIQINALTTTPKLPPHRLNKNCTESSSKPTGTSQCRSCSTTSFAGGICGRQSNRVVISGGVTGYCVLL